MAEARAYLHVVEEELGSFVRLCHLLHTLATKRLYESVAASSAFGPPIRVLHLAVAPFMNAVLLDSVWVVAERLVCGSGSV
jgi:hypothetical protein